MIVHYILKIKIFHNIGDMYHIHLDEGEGFGNPISIQIVANIKGTNASGHVRRPDSEDFVCTPSYDLRNLTRT